MDNIPFDIVPFGFRSSSSAAVVPFGFGPSSSAAADMGLRTSCLDQADKRNSVAID